MVGWSLDPQTGFPPSASGLSSEPRAVSSRRAVTPGGGPPLSWALCPPGFHTSHPGPEPSSLGLFRLPPAAGASGRRRWPPRVFPMPGLPFFPAAPKCCREEGRPSWALPPHDLPAPLGASRVRITGIRPLPAREAGSTLRAPRRTSRLGWMAPSADRVVVLRSRRRYESDALPLVGIGSWGPSLGRWDHGNAPAARLRRPGKRSTGPSSRCPLPGPRSPLDHSASSRLRRAFPPSVDRMGRPVPFRVAAGLPGWSPPCGPPVGRPIDIGRDPTSSVGFGRTLAPVAFFGPRRSEELPRPPSAAFARDLLPPRASRVLLPGSADHAAGEPAIAALGTLQPSGDRCLSISLGRHPAHS